MAAFDAGIAFDPVDATHALNGVPHDVTIGTRATPKYAAYKTKDGQALLLATIEGKFWVEFCQLVGRPDLIPEHRHDLPSDWGHDHPHLYDELSAIFATRTLGEWMRLLRTHPLPISAINPLSKVVDTEHFRDRAMTRTTVGPSGKTVPTIRPAVIYNSERLGPAGRWSELGEDTTDVLLKSGFDPEQIERLVAAGAIRQGDR
jgi:formyl-CoA transferase